jgi:hypothetical protein
MITNPIIRMEGHSYMAIMVEEGLGLVKDFGDDGASVPTKMTETTAVTINP